MTEKPNRIYASQISIRARSECLQYDTDQAVIQSVSDPQPESLLGEERVLLAEHVQMRVTVENTSRDELIKYANNEWRKDGKEDVVEGERPRFIGDLTGEVV